MNTDRYTFKRNLYLVECNPIDQLIITELYHRKVLNSELICLLADHFNYNSKSIYNRLHILSKRGIIFKKRYPDNNTQKFLNYYYLTNVGVRIYCILHNIPFNEYENGQLTFRHHKEWHELEMKPRAVPHHIETERFCIQLKKEIGDYILYSELDAYESPYKIFTKSGSKSIVVPDKILTDHDRHKWVNIETDRSTTKQHVIKTKFDRYAHYISTLDSLSVHSILFNIAANAGSRPQIRLRTIFNTIFKSREFLSLILSGRAYVWACFDYQLAFSLIRNFFDTDAFFSSARELIREQVSRVASDTGLNKKVGLPYKEDNQALAPDYIAHIGDSIFLFLLARHGDLSPLVRASSMASYLQQSKHYLCLVYPTRAETVFGKSLMDGPYHFVSVDNLYEWLLERL